ncbi:MAG: nucleotidyl transferase AbiEii/AbiGii toxin family protein [Ignavibacteriales bacterium]|nr:nucleotidyl transferase AbiEii/AbiGii toxin family protein [Ignavibacteriales bacterium]
MFSKEYLNKLSEKTGFRSDSLQKQMTLLDLLREINRHPLLSKQFALKGGTAINLFYFQLPRLSVDIDLNYIGNIERETMLEERPKLEKEMKRLIQSRGISVENAPTEEHAGAKWRLRAPSAFGGNFTLEVDLNYIMRIPVWGVELKRPYPLDEDYMFGCRVVSIEELFSGKIKALLDRSAARDLYDVFKLSQVHGSFDMSKLRKNLILFGITCDDDWREKNFHTVDGIDQKMVDEQLNPLRMSNQSVDLDMMKNATKNFLSELLQYDEGEKRFMNRFLDEGIYEPELLFTDVTQSTQLKNHPAVLWKLQHHRKHFGIDNKS